jgi:integrase
MSYQELIRPSMRRLLKQHAVSQPLERLQAKEFVRCLSRSRARCRHDFSRNQSHDPRRDPCRKEGRRGSGGGHDRRRRDRENSIGRDRRQDTPDQARHFLDAMRGLFRWAVKAKLVASDPTIGVDNPPRPKTDGFAVWSDDDIAAYEKRWPIGTRQRVWLDVLIYTGLRRGDAVRFGRQHVRNGVGSLKTEKNDTAVTLPILPVLSKTLEVGPCGDLTFIAGENGRPLTKESFGNLFRRACHAAGLRDRSAHGLRKAAATRAANAGATVAQLEAIFGWNGGTMAALYTRAADRRRLAMEGMHMLADGRLTDEAAN